jgi:hypothetical protein
MTDAKPKALQLVEESENGDWIVGTGQWREEAAAELRRLHEENTALRQAIEQAEKQMPVAYKYTDKTNPLVFYFTERKGKDVTQNLYVIETALYTAPPQREWVGLTDAELAEFSDMKLGAYDLCLEVEAKLMEKNGGS